MRGGQRVAPVGGAACTIVYSAHSIGGLSYRSRWTYQTRSVILRHTVTALDRAWPHRRLSSQLAHDSESGGRSSKCTDRREVSQHSPVEMQTRDLLPLDPLAEVHANCSRVAIDAGEISAVLANTLLENINDLANAAAAQHQMPL